MSHPGSLDKIQSGNRFSENETGKLWRVVAFIYEPNHANVCVDLAAESNGEVKRVPQEIFLKNYSFFDKGSIYWRTPVICECGSDKINWHMHSDYCPKYAKEPKK